MELFGLLFPPTMVTRGGVEGPPIPMLLLLLVPELVVPSKSGDIFPASPRPTWLWWFCACWLWLKFKRSTLLSIRLFDGAAPIPGAGLMLPIPSKEIKVLLDMEVLLRLVVLELSISIRMSSSSKWPPELGVVVPLKSLLLLKLFAWLILWVRNSESDWFDFDLIDYLFVDGSHGTACVAEEEEK